MYTLKTPRVKLDPERVHWGQTPYRVKDDPEICQLSADLTNNGVRLTQLCVIFRVRLTDFRVIADPEWSLPPMDPLRVKFDPGVFRVYTHLSLTVVDPEGGAVGAPLNLDRRCFFESQFVSECLKIRLRYHERASKPQSFQALTTGRGPRP